MKELMKFRKITCYTIPSYLYWFFSFPKLMIMYLWYKFKCENFDIYMDVLRVVNELRKVCKGHGDKDKNGNWNVKCFYLFNGRSVKVKVRFDKKAGEIVYNKFKEDVQNYTHNTSDYEYKRGYGYFYIILDYKPLKKIVVNRHSVSIGTNYGGLYLWEFVKNPHALIVGDTGQGKSTELYYLISGLYKEKYEIYLIDGKTIDFNDCQNAFYKYIAFDNKEKNYEEIINFIIDFKDDMYARLELMKKMGIKNYMKSKELMPVFLIFDEYLVVTDGLDKKMKDRIKTEIGTIVRTGRACGFFVVLTMQRADSEFITTSIRDNFKLKLVLGEASDISYQMMFESQEFKGFPVGKGWVKQGNKLDVLHVPLYEQVELSNE